MIVFDTDVLVEILKDTPAYVARSKSHTDQDQFVPIVVVEELIRGRLNAIRRAEAGKIRISIDQAYELFQRTFLDFQNRRILPYTAVADAQFISWRSAGIRVSTHDLRIAAISAINAATLVTRNRRDIDQVPGLVVEYWG